MHILLISDSSPSSKINKGKSKSSGVRREESILFQLFFFFFSLQFVLSDTTKVKQVIRSFSVIISFQILGLFKLYGRIAVFCIKLTLGLSFQGFCYKCDARNMVVDPVK